MAKIEIPPNLLPKDGRFGSGPSKVRDEGLAALQRAAKTVLGTSHRQAPAKEVVARVRRGLAQLLGLPEGYEIILGNGGSTAFWDIATFCLIEHKSEHLSFGEFSSKFAAAAEQAPFLAEPRVERAEYGTRPEAIADESVDVYALTHNETSTGVSMPISRPRHRDGTVATGLVLVDGTSAAAGLRFDPLESDVYYFAPQKGLGSDGGLWLAACSPAALERSATIAASGRFIPAFLDFNLAIENSRLEQTYNTPALATLLLACAQIEWFNAQGGMEWSASRSDRSAEILYGWAERCSYAHPFVEKPDDRSHVIATIDFEEAIDAAALAKVLREHGIVDTEPYRKLGRNQLRIAMFPGIDPDDIEALTACIDFVVNALERGEERAMAFDTRRLVLAGASSPGDGSPGGSISEVLARVLRPYVYALEVLPTGNGPANARAVVASQCDLGVMNIALVLAAREGSGEFSADGPLDLRVAANVNHPSWLAIAVRGDLQISDLGEIVDRKLPVRLRAGSAPLTELLLGHYGLDDATLAALGGARLALSDPDDDEQRWAREGDFDVIVDLLYSGYAPRVRHWHDASAAHTLSFLPVPDEVARNAFKAGLGEWSTLPAWLVRGLSRPVASVARHPYAVYGSAAMPNGFARLVAQALDENRAMLRTSNVALSYDPLNVAMSYGAPLHPGAHRYYTSMRYPVGEAAEDHDHGEGEDHSHGAGDISGHVHLGGANALPSLWDRVGVNGPGALTISRFGVYAKGEKPKADDPDKATENAAPSWQGGFGKH